LFLAPIDCLKIPALAGFVEGRHGVLTSDDMLWLAALGAFADEDFHHLSPLFSTAEEIILK
jgi:hypothetical protein